MEAGICCTDYMGASLARLGALSLSLTQLLTSSSLSLSLSRTHSLSSASEGRLQNRKFSSRSRALTRASKLTFNCFVLFLSKKCFLICFVETEFLNSSRLIKLGNPSAAVNINFYTEWISLKVSRCCCGPYYKHFRTAALPGKSAFSETSKFRSGR